MEKSNQIRLAKHIFRLLKVDEIIIPIGRTNKGNLGIKFSENNEDYEIMLDSIPLSTKDFLADENNIELKKMLDKYLFEEKKDDKYLTHNHSDVDSSVIKAPATTTETLVPKHEKSSGMDTELDAKILAPKRRGRPAGAKNKVK